MKINYKYTNNMHILSSIPNTLNWSSDAEFKSSSISVFNYVETAFF